MKSALAVPTGAPDGLVYLQEFLTPDFEGILLSHLSALDWDTRGLFRRRGKIVKRREIDFSHDYGRHNRLLTAGAPLPFFLEQVRDACAESIGIDAGTLQQVIVALYRPGAGIDWHTDAIRALGEPICGVSLGAPCTMRFRQRGETGDVWSLRLDPRSLLVFQGPARWDYEYQIPPLRETRYSITLRTLLERQCSALCKKPVVEQRNPSPPVSGLLG